MDSQHQIRTIRRRWRPIVFLAAGGAALGATSAAVAHDADPLPVPVVHYDACHSLLVDSAVPTAVAQWDVRNLAQLAERVTQGEIPVAVAAAVGADSTDVSTQVRVGVRNDIESLSICTVGDTPSEVEVLADQFATSLLEALNADAGEFAATELAAARSRISDAQSCKEAAEASRESARAVDPLADVGALDQEVTLCDLQLIQARTREINLEAAGVPIVPLMTLERAEAVAISEATFNIKIREGAAGANVAVGVGASVGATSPAAGSTESGPSIPESPLARALVGMLAGSGLGLGWVQFAERLDSRLRRKDDVESTLDLPVLAEIPPLGRRNRKLTRMITIEEPRSRSTESFRALRSALDYARMVDEEHGRALPGAQVVLVTSAGPSEGKTTTLANLAAVMAEGERSVLAVNCDFRRPRLHLYLGGPTEAQRLNATDVPGVQLVTQVTENDSAATPSEVVAAQRRLVEIARERFDVILLDTAPILTTNDASELLTVADHVILVVSAGQTRAENAARAIELLERRGRPPLGVALIGTRDVPNSSEYYYSDSDPYLERGQGRGSKRRAKRANSESASVRAEVPAPG